MRRSKQAREAKVAKLQPEKTDSVNHREVFEKGPALRHFSTSKLKSAELLYFPRMDQSREWNPGWKAMQRSPVQHQLLLGKD